MDNQANERKEIDADESAQFIEFLRRHPDFLLQQPELLGQLEIPHATHGATSLIERQVGVLRDRNRQLESTLDELFSQARNNESLVERVHRLALTLIEATDLTSALAAIIGGLRQTIGADEVTLALPAAWAEGQELEELRPLDTQWPSELAQLCESDQPRCGVFQATTIQYLFGERAEHVSSAAIIPMRIDDEPVVIALGGHEAERFSEEMGTLFLSRVSELVSAALRTRRW